MKVLFLASKPPYPPIDGIRIKTYNLIKELAKEHEVFLVSFFEDTKDINSPAFIAFAEICKETVMIQKPCKPNVLFRIVNDIFSSVPSFIKEYRSDEFTKKVSEAIKEFKPDVIHFDTVNLTSYVNDLKGMAPCVASPNDCLSLAYLDDFFFGPWFVRRIPNKIWKIIQLLKIRRYERKIYKHFQKCYVVSREDKKHLEKICKEADIEIIPNGVDVDYYKPDKDSNHGDMPSIIFFGDMSGGNSEYALWFLKHVFPKINKDVRNIKIYIVGNNPSERLKKLSSNNPQIIVTGYVDDIRPFIEKSDIVISPILKRCGILNKVLIAMAMGKPIVGTKYSFMGIQGMINGVNAIAVEEKRGFIEQIVYLLKEDKKARLIGENARLLVEESYNWNYVSIEVEKLYQEAAKKYRRNQLGHERAEKSDKNKLP